MALQPQPSPSPSQPTTNNHPRSRFHFLYHLAAHTQAVETKSCLFRVSRPCPYGHSSQERADLLSPTLYKPRVTQSGLSHLPPAEEPQITALRMKTTTIRLQVGCGVSSRARSRRRRGGKASSSGDLVEVCSWGLWLMRSSLILRESIPAILPVDALVLGARG